MVVAVNAEYIGTLTIFLAILCNRVSSQNGCALLKNEYIIDVSLPEAPAENGNSNYDKKFLGFRGAVGSIQLDVEQDDSTVDFHSNFKIYLGIADFNYGFCIKRIGNVDRDGKTSKYSDDNSILEYTIVCTDLSTSIKLYYPLIIRITDLNDNPPVFQDEPYQISVDTSTANSSTLIRVVATDKDIDKNRHIVYGIESGAGTLNDASQYFHFPVISSGALSLKKKIDIDAFKSEGISSMNLNIFAMDMGRKSLRTDSSIKVNINFDGEEIVKKIDKPLEAEKPDRGRDHCVLLDRPEFSNGSIKVKLPEVISSNDLSAHPYKYRTFIGIKDTVTNINLIPDSEEVGVEYVIPQSGQRGYYIRIKQVIDRDGDTSSRTDDINNLKFDLECESNDRITVFPLTIHITDINDNAPVFENEDLIEFSVSAGDDDDLPREVFNISKFSSVSDKDLGPNRRISYSISPISDEKGSEYFIVDKSGTIHQVKHISDEEGLDYLYFNVTVTDNARNIKKRKSSSKTAKVEVLYQTTTTTSTTAKPVVCNIDTSEFTSHKHGIYHLEINEVRSEQHFKDHTDEYTRYIGFNDEAQISLVQHGDNDINPGEYFELIVEGNKQYIRLIKPIDRDGETESKSDDTNQVEFTVECKQNGPIKYYPIVIHIDDVNDNVPVFQNTPYLLNINEATQPGVVVYRSISAIDTDLGTNREITYGIVPNPKLKPDYSSYFEISDPMVGEITLVQPLDFEKLQTKEFQLNISATNSAPTVERLSSYTRLSITVIDSDDLPPVFHYSSCKKKDNVCFNPVYKTVVKSGIVSGRLSDIYPVPENKLNETVSIQARDQDTLNHAIVFTIDESIPDGYTDYFTVETTGPNNDGYYSALVNQVKIIQRSSVQKLKLILKAKEDSSEYKMTRAELDIVVIPSNLNPPRLVSSSGQFTGYIEENSKLGSFVIRSSSSDSDRLQISVEDDDLLPSDQPRDYDYSISPDTVFDIDDEGFITNIAAVDREKISQYSLTLTITETDTVEKHKVSTSLVVYVLDVNDNAPMFTRKSTQVNITEGDYSFSPKKLALVSALDDDTGESGRLTYSILDVRPEGEENFKINKETGELTATGQLNAKTLYAIRVQASDNGVPPRSSMSVIEVNTIQRPNSAPYFSKDVYKFNIPEDSETGKHVFQFEAFDPDSDELNYAITSGNIGQTFSIDSSSENSGELVVNGLDFESIQSYDLIITATDKRGLTGETTVHINVTDINDNDPIFTSDVYEGSLIEGDYTISPKQVLIIKAEDKDSSYNGQVEYAITKSSPPEPAISINSESGAIEVNGIVKGGTIYTMTVQATDKAPTPKSSTSRVKLTVIPQTLVNNAPVIPQSDYTVSVSEGTALSSEIVRISASDPDSDVLTYKIVNQIPESSAFQIDESGKILNTELLDREEVDEYTLQVEVTDSQGLSSDTKVVIKVTDMNDNRPQFTHKNYVFSLVEGQMGQFVVAAFDTDEVETGNSLVTYSFSEPSDKFDISSDGKITTKAPLDREENEKYELVVVASDNGLPVMTSTANIRIQVTDTSDSVPMFNPSIYEVRVPAGKRGYSVVTVKAVDADVVKNVIYIFEDGDIADFTIDSITGEIKTRKPLNVASKPFYSFTVTTTDGQGVSSALVSVTVVGEDEEIVKPTIIVSEPIIPKKQQPTKSEKPVDVGDDRPPVFSYPTCRGDCRRPEYAASVQSAASLFELSMFPMPSDNPTLTVPLKARDPNTPESPLNFTISRTVPPGLELNFVVRTSGPDNEGFYSATVKQIEALYVDKTPHVEVIVRATEDSSNKLYSEGSVYINVQRYYVIEGKLTAESTADTLSQMNILTFLTILTIFYLL